MDDSISARRERIPVRVMPDHDSIAAEVAGRIAALIRERASEGRSAVLGLATGSTPVGVYRELIRLHHEGGARLLQRGDLQPRRVLPHAARQHSQLPPLHAGEPLRPHQHPPGAMSHPQGRPAGGRGRSPLPRLRAPHPRCGRHRPATAGDRSQRAHRIQRAGLGAGFAYTAHLSRHGDALGRLGGLLRRGETCRRKRSPWGSRPSWRRAK